jgi:DNA-binding response OmpR family regulator
MPRVLIADDEESMRTLVARAIAMDGHEIVTAEDGALALAAARDFPELTILLMTGFADQRERAHGLNAIVHDVVTKPFTVTDIRTAVAQALAARHKAC